MRNPNWTVDELILALDLYFTLKSKDLVPTNPAIIELSELLRSLPIHKNKPNDEKFRNPNGVTMVLWNISRSDPNTDICLKHGSKLQKKIWSYYIGKREYLHKVATAIRNCLPLPFEYNLMSDLDERDFIQGSILYQYHKYLDNNWQTVNRLRKRARSRGRLYCEKCGFDFYEIYGNVGDGFIECHHKIDVIYYKNNIVVKDSDFILVCSNCHRMLHRGYKI